MIPQDLVIISNTIIMATTLVATMYRIRIERDHIKLIKKETEYKNRIETFRIMLEKEREEILSMTPEEICKMLETVWKD